MFIFNLIKTYIPERSLKHEKNLMFWFWTKKFGFDTYTYQKRTLVFVPDTKTWFRSYTKWLNPRNHYSSGVLGMELVVPFFIHSRSPAFKLSTLLCEHIIIWVKTLPDFTQMMILSPNTSFWPKIWWHFCVDLRGREQEWVEIITTNSAP